MVMCDWIGIVQTHVIGAHLFSQGGGIKEFRVYSKI
jgi:hypothetical protein